MDKSKNLSGAYALETPQDSKDLYRDWAETYDADFVEDHGYQLHELVAQAFVSAGGSGPVLDLGAGTGAVGAALRRRHVDDVHATDISPEMLAVAQNKDIYSELFEGNILERLPRADGCYSGIVSAGTCTLGHVGRDGFDEILRLLAPGGLAVISVRDTHYETAGFAAKITLSEPVLSGVSLKPVRIYTDTAVGTYANDSAILVHMWKA